MKTLLLALGLFSLTAHAMDPVCNNRAVNVIVNSASAQRLIDYVMAIDSIPLSGRVLSRSGKTATVEIKVIDDLGEGGSDAFDVARVVKSIYQTEPDGLGIQRVMADVCFPDKGSGTGDSGNVGTIGHQ